MKYALIIVGEESAWTSLPQEQVDDWYRRIAEWSERLGGKDTGEGQELAGISEAKSAHRGAVTDGPYVESREVAGGWEIVTADSIDEAADRGRPPRRAPAPGRRRTEWPPPC